MTGPAAPTAYRRGRTPLGYFEGDRVVVVMPDGERLAVQVIPRADFIDRYWDYRPGEHVLVVAPNGNGKTTLIYQLLEATAHPKMPAYVMIAKPYDETSQQWAKGLGWPIIRDYPPPLLRRMDPPAGYMVWPKHSFHPNPRIDDWHLADVFSRLLHVEYKKNPRRHGPRIVVADEIMAVEELETADKPPIRLVDQTKVMLSRGRSGGFGGIGGTQRPVEISGWWYSECKHLLYGNTPEKRALDRYDEIGGMADPGVVRAVARCLPQFYFGYNRRRDRTMCVVGP